VISVTVCDTIDAPPSEVWAAIEHIESHIEWMQDAVRITFTSEQRQGVGASFECLTKIGPLSTKDRFVVTKWCPGAVMGIEHHGAVTGYGEFRLRADGDDGAGSTRFCWEERLQFPWWLGSTIGEQIGRPVLQRVWRGNVARLKASIERPREPERT
jgi:polyketide cyclase/dehydrase/lipid transport protein